MITSEVSTWPAGDLVWQVCQAIALAEGANVPGSAPDRYNNPGDLSQGDEHGQAVLGYITLPDGERLINFASKDGGWQALYSKINNIRIGASTVYSPSMTWNQIAQEYAGNATVWASNVAAALGVSPDSRFGDYFTAGGMSPGSALGPRRKHSAGHS